MKCIKDILSKFKMQESKPIPIAFDYVWPKTQEEKSEDDNIPYCQVIGFLMSVDSQTSSEVNQSLVISVATRPDITHAVNFLSQFNNNPDKPHWTATKRIQLYLKGTQDQGVIFKSDAESLTVFIDADRASDVTDRKSYTGYLFKYAGGAISWESRKQ